VTPERVYALVRCDDGWWLLLNRRYKPFGVGASASSWFEYDHCDGIRAWLRERDLKRLDGGSARYRPGDQMVWLYSDETDPRLGAAQLRAYRRRLSILDFEEAAA
jgi:hypothetical protein